jgi:tetratricopeptide (TPR) repeat protein
MCLAVTFNCAAQKNKKAKTEAETPVVQEEAPTGVVTEECEINQSLYYESAKNKNYADALAPWEKVYNECPFINKTLYTYGVRIINWQIEQEKDAAQKKILVAKLMKLYDDQIKYFGKDEKQPKAWILGMKAYYSLLYEPAEFQTPYDFVKEAVSSLKKNSEPLFVQQYAITAYELFKAGKISAENYINDYLLTAEVMAENMKDTTTSDYKTYRDLKPSIDQMFAVSGAANCEQLEKIYSAQVDANLNNLDYLKTTIRLFKMLKCTEENAYFKAAVAAHKIEKSYESAAACADMYFKNKDYSKAISYLKEAVELTEDKEQKASSYFYIAVFYQQLGNKPSAREYAQLSLDAKPGQGEPYLLIATLYAGSTISDEPIINRSVYWVAVDMCERAKQAEPTSSIIEKANKMIGSYRSAYPSKEEIFMFPDMQEGQSYTVGGWIGRSTVCRAK